MLHQIIVHLQSLTLREKCSYSELFSFASSSIRTEYREIQSISPYSIQMRENMDQNNSEYGQFLRSVTMFCKNSLPKLTEIGKVKFH